MRTRNTTQTTRRSIAGGDGAARAASWERCRERSGARGTTPWRTLYRVLALGLAFCFLLAVVAPAALGGQEVQGVGPAIGSVAPDAALEDLDGNPVRLLDYIRGKPALIEFWASWCENCEALQPQLDEIHARWGHEIAVVAIAVGVGQTPRRVKRYVEEHGAGFPYLWDVRGEAVRAYSAATTSIVVLLDAHAKVVYTGVGPQQDLVAAVKKLLRS